MTQLKKIINYWNNNKLSDIYSSTSDNNIIFSFIDNYIENKILSKILIKKFKKTLDVGCGYGRFFKTLLNNSKIVYGLEPAKNIYKICLKKYKNLKKIKLYNNTLENFKTKNLFDLFIISGVAYFYNNKQKQILITEIKKRAYKNHTIIFRDFINPTKNTIIKSKFIKNGFCYYQDINYWISFAKKNKYKITFIGLSKNPLFFYRKKIFKKFTNNKLILYIIKILQIHKLLYLLKQKKIPKKNKIYTVFIKMESYE